MKLTNVRWLKFPVDLPQSPEAFLMRHACRNGKSSRDLLFSVWIELFAFAGRLDENGLFLRQGKPMSPTDLAKALGRRTNGVVYALDWLLRYGILTIDPETGAYAFPDWAAIQSTARLKKVRQTSPAVCDEESPEESAGVRFSAGIREEKIREDKKRKEKRREEERREDAPAPDGGDALLRRSEEEKARRAQNPLLKAQYERLRAASLAEHPPV